MGRKNYIEDIPPEIPDYIRELMEKGELVDEIILDSEGNWFHNGVEFTNKKIITFFNKSINKTSDGTIVLHYSNFTFPITVEDVPVFITGVRFEGFGPFEKIHINLSTGDTEILDIDTLYYNDNNALYCTVCDGKFHAKFKRSPSFHILERLEEQDNTYYLNIAGKRIRLEQKAK